MKASSHDIVIVGGGPAGITTALALVTHAPELASRVVVLEKARYPRDKYCAGAIGARGLQILASLGVSPDVPHVPIRGISLLFEGGELASRLPGPPMGQVVRRIEFDHALARAAMARGVVVREGVRVTGVRREGTGAVVETSEGEVSARIVVGADGVGSAVRKAMGLPAGSLRAQVLELDTEPVPSDRERGLIHFDASDRTLDGYAWDFPTVVAGRQLVCRGVYLLKTHRESTSAKDIHAILAARLEAIGLEIARYENKRYAERGLDPADRVADGPMMLVGEAAGIDPATGEGIAQAIEYGSLAGSFLARARDAADASGWGPAFRRSRLGGDLRIRRRIALAAYAPTRRELESFMLANPDAFFVGCQHFAGVPHDPMKLAGVLVRGAVSAAAYGIGRVLGARA